MAKIRRVKRKKFKSISSVSLHKLSSMGIGQPYRRSLMVKKGGVLRNKLNFTGGGPVPFVTSWATTGVDETITIQANNPGTYDAEMTWYSDAALTIEVVAPKTITSYNDPNLSTVLPVAGTYYCKITGTFDRINLAGAPDSIKLRTVESFGAVGWTSLTQSFNGCTGLTSVKNFGNMSGLTGIAFHFTFYGCTSLTSVDFSGITSTPNVTTMESMFQNCTSLVSIDLSPLDFSGILGTSSMFRFCSALKNVTLPDPIDISSLTNATAMFTFVGLNYASQDHIATVFWEAYKAGNANANVTLNLASGGNYSYKGLNAIARLTADDAGTGAGWTITSGSFNPALEDISTARLSAQLIENPDGFDNDWPWNLSTAGTVGPWIVTPQSGIKGSTAGSSITMYSDATATIGDSWLTIFDGAGFEGYGWTIFLVNFSVTNTLGPITTWRTCLLNGTNLLRASTGGKANAFVAFEHARVWKILD